MALQQITENFLGGISNTENPALLAPGELQRADDCVVRDAYTAIHRAPGRTAYNSSPLSAGLKGLVHLSFDQNTDQVIAWPAGNGTSSNLYKSDFTGITGSFSIITGPGQVTNCTISGTTTVTAAAGSFTNMFVGVRVSGTGVPSGTIVDTVTSDTVIVLSQASTNGSGITLTFDAGIAVSMSDQTTDILDFIQWQSTYFLLPRNGSVNRLQWRPFSGTVAEQLIVRPAGMLPITEAPVVSQQSGAGWSSVLGIGYYWFLVTELISYDGGATVETEAGYTANGGRPVSVQISAYASQFIRVTFPTIKNDGSSGKNRATHWGVYMSVIGPGAAAYADNSNAPSAATFRRVMTVDISETSKDIKFNNTTQPATGGSLPTTSAAVGSLGQFTNPGGVFTRGGTVASTVTTLAKANAFAGFGLSSASPYSGYTVTGIKVNAVVKNSGGIPLTGFDVWIDNASTKISNHKYGVATFNYTTIPFGGQFNTWGIAWVPGDISTIRVMIQKNASSTTAELYIDYIEIIVYYSGASLDTGSVNLDGVPYQVVTYRSQIGTTVNDPANYLIPSASTGDIFQGSLVLNDVSNPAVIRYSLPNIPESFPKPYFMKFESKKKDIVNFIRKVGQVLVVGMRDSIKRINYLPTETDVDFGQGVAHEDIVTDHGIVGPLAGTLVDMPNTGVVLAYIAQNGFYITDGITDRQFNANVDIETLCKTSALSTSVLRVYPREKWLVFYYCPAGATHTKNTRALIFSYSQTHRREDGTLPAFGPITISARSAAEANLNGTTYLLTGHQTSGVVYVEDSGNTQASGYQVHNSSDALADAPIQPFIRTRRMYPSGFSRDAREQRLYILHDAIGTSYTIASSTTISSTTVTSAALFGNVIVGMYVSGTGIPAGSIVTAKASSSSITVSQAATVTGTPNLTFDDGTISTKIRGASIDTTPFDMTTFYLTTLTGDIMVFHHDNMEQGLELQIEKVVLPSAASADLNQAMRLYTFTYLAEDAGTEMNRGS